MAGDSRKAEFKTHVRRWAAKLSVDVTGIYVRPIRSQWASCPSNGVLSFNAELLELEPKVWDYVIVHELLHFDLPNHGKLWKSLMRAHVGDWEASEALLRRHESSEDAARNASANKGHGVNDVERK